MKMTPWYAIGSGFQCSMRAPYCDLEILPAERGWQWRVSRIEPGTGRFVIVATGTDDRLSYAKLAAVDAAKVSR